MKIVKIIAQWLALEDVPIIKQYDTVRIGFTETVHIMGYPWHSTRYQTIGHMINGEEAAMDISRGDDVYPYCLRARQGWNGYHQEQ